MDVRKVTQCVFIRTLRLSMLMALGCKQQGNTLSSRIEAEETPNPRIVFAKPMVEQRRPPLSVDQALALVPGLKENLVSYKLYTDSFDYKDTILWAQGGNIVLPVMRVDQERLVWAFDEEVSIQPGPDDESITVLPSGIIFMRPANQIPNSLGEAVPVIPIRPVGGQPKLSRVTDILNLPETTLYRLENTYVDARGQEQFSLVSVAPQVWRLDGKFSSSMFCSGSVIWQEQDQWYSLTRHYDRELIGKWNQDGEVLAFQGIVPKSELVNTSVSKWVKPCKDSIYTNQSQWIGGLAYNERAPLNEGGKSIKDFEWGADYPFGSLISFDQHTWKVIDSRPALGFYRLLNFGRVTAEDQGRQMTRVYEIRKSGSAKTLHEMGTTRQFVLGGAEAIDAASHERIRSQEIANAIQSTAAHKLQIAEAKANSVGAGWGEAHKVFINILANAATDLMLNPSFATSNAKIIGLKPTGSTIQGAITTVDVPLKNRMAAFLGYSLVEATINASIPFVVKLQRGDSEGAISTFKMALSSTGLVHAMRGFAALTPNKTDDILLFSGSGLVMRWRKIKMEEAIGYQNLNQVLNLGAGALTSYLQVLAINSKASPGRVKAIAKGGVLVSEIISGRGYPGVIIGGLGEIVVDLSLKNALYRPLLNTMASQLSAIIQIGDAAITTQNQSQQLEHTRQIMMSQASLYNSLVYLLKTQPDIFESFDYMERATVVGTLSDPFRVIRQHYEKR